jgi:hypothetical protein
MGNCPFSDKNNFYADYYGEIGPVNSTKISMGSLIFR